VVRRHAVVTGFVVASLVIPSVGLSQAPVAERPVWKVGYKWSFHTVSTAGPASDWNREVIEVRPGGQFVVRTEDGKTMVFDEDANLLNPLRPESTWKRFAFPLFVGKRWTHDRKIGNSSNQGYETTSWEVKAYEALKVPAGTFDCFRVEGARWQTQSQGIYPRRQGHEDYSYWYCPAVKWIGKAKSHRADSQYSSYIDTEQVLTSFVSD